MNKNSHTYYQGLALSEYVVLFTFFLTQTPEGKKVCQQLEANWAAFSVERIRIHLDGPVLPDLFTIDKIPPPRVVCDFDGVLMVSGLAREMDLQGRMIRKVRIGQEDRPYPRTRVVLEMDKNLAGRIEQEFFEKESLFVLTVFESGQ